MPSQPTASQHTPYVSKGMPALDMSGKQTSFFEFWPTWLMYFPVVVQSLLLALWHRSLTLPLIANPKLPLSGMVGVEKSQLLATAQGQCKKTILAWFVYACSSDPLDNQVSVIEQKMANQGLVYPLVCKPDIGCRGSGVKLIKQRSELAQALSCYPEGAGVMLQTLASWEPEAGLFYVREPKQATGRIVSLALKYSPYVVGDGLSSLRLLIQNDPRAGELSHLYLTRHHHKLDTVLAAGEPFRLVFSASHCRGAIFRDAQQYITPALTTKIDALLKELPEFYYGRLDIKFRDLESFMQGENFEIIEINSASSESLHIWDRNTSFFEATRALLFQYRTLFTLGAQNRQRGFTPPPLKSLLKAWQKERKLTHFHPDTD